jgi:hypothetical protein
MANLPTFCFVIPCVGPTVGSVREAMGGRGDYEIVLVNDASTDRTYNQGDRNQPTASSPVPIRLTLGDNTGSRSYEANSDVYRDGSPLRDGRLRRQSANVDERAWPARPSRSGRTSRRTGTAGASCALASRRVARDPRAMRSSRVRRPVRSR